jgi:ABC-2 type transport system permease protein
MKKAWLTAAATYRRRVRSGMFLILTFGLPMIMVLAAVVPLWRNRSGNLPPIGYIDETGQVSPRDRLAAGQRAGDQLPADSGGLDVVTLPDAEAARAALRQGEIAGYLVIPADYFTGGRPTYYAPVEPTEQLETALEWVLRGSLLAEEPRWVAARLQSPAHLTFVARASGVALRDGPAVAIRIAFPAFLGMLLALVLFTSAGQMGSAVVREKDQRAMEIVITSMAPRELVAGKILGMTLLSLTQVAVWLVGGALAVALGLSRYVDLRTLSIPWPAVGWAVALGVPTYFLYATLAAGLGVIGGDNQQAQQLAGVLGLVALAPLWLLAPVLSAPNGSLAVGLTLFPLTGAVISLVRLAMADVPAWQLTLSVAALLVCLAGSMWAVTRIFRAAMLMYGQVLRPRQLWQALSSA